MTETTETTTATYRSKPGGGPADPAVRRFVFLAITAGLLVTVALFGREEMGRWHEAAAINAFADRRFEDSIQSANKALAWDPENDDMVTLRAQARMQNGDLEGCLEDLDAMIAAAAKNDADEGRDEQDIQLLSEKARVAQRMDDHQLVQSIWTSIVDFRAEEYRKRDDHDSRLAYSWALNNRAYMIAQAFSATGDAAFDVAEAMEQSRLSIELRKVDDDPVLLDTYGYLLLLNDRPDEAFEKLDLAVKLTTKEQDAKRAKMASVADQRRIQDILRELDNQYAVILHHRGEAYEALGDSEKAAADIQEAIRRGYNPEAGVW